MSTPITVIGGGLAGSEAALQLAHRGIPVTLHEMRPIVPTTAHTSGNLAEVVCSNSFGSMDAFSANGLLMEEGLRLGSALLAIGKAVMVPAGMALAVDRAAFSAMVTAKIEAEPLITIRRDEVTSIDPDQLTLLATGPLTTQPLMDWLAAQLGAAGLYFFDAISPSVVLDSLDIEGGGLFWAARGDTGGDDQAAGDYLNVPLDRGQYDDFWNALVTAERQTIKDFEPDKIFQGCQPAELIAQGGYESLRYGPMKPLGLDDPRTGRWPHAVLQLRREERNLETLNLVGFQTRLTWPEQKRVFGMLPGFANAQWSRLGSMHKNFYIDSPRHLNPDLALRAFPNLFLAGQITGSEGYLEAVVTGLVAGINLARRVSGESTLTYPEDTMLGSLLAAMCDPAITRFQPFNVHYGMLPDPPPPVGKRKWGKREKRELQAGRARTSLESMTGLAVRVPG
ncbi:MAG: methylenetetrahydrofolate--tRNA-(uracil(54)-C(5))-methyltransferase (FADH(2)-oxidizing) TrmFO [bacterium]